MWEKLIIKARRYKSNTGFLNFLKMVPLKKLTFLCFIIAGCQSSWGHGCSRTHAYFAMAIGKKILLLITAFQDIFQIPVRGVQTKPTLSFESLKP